MPFVRMNKKVLLRAFYSADSNLHTDLQKQLWEYMLPGFKKKNWTVGQFLACFFAAARETNKHTKITTRT